MPEGDKQVTLEWVAPTHLRAERTNDWFWALGIVAVFGSIAAVLLGNILFAAIILLATVMLGVTAMREPRECSVQLNPQGIVIDSELYPYRSIHSFWVDEREHLAAPKLFLATSGIVHPHITVILKSHEDADAVRNYLHQFIEEDEGHTFGTMFAELLGL